MKLSIAVAAVALLGRAVEALPQPLLKDLESRSTLTYRPSVGSYNHVSCRTDTSAHILTLKSQQSSKMTPAMCAAYCSGNTYFGLEAGNMCYCGKQLSGGSVVTQSHCNQPCGGNSQFSCGATGFMDLYLLATTSSTTSTTSHTSTTSTTSHASTTSTTSTTSHASTTSTTSTTSHASTTSTTSHTSTTSTTAASSTPTVSRSTSTTLTTAASSTSTTSTTAASSTPTVSRSTSTTSTTAVSSTPTVSRSTSTTSTTAVSSTPTANSGKRGLCYNDASLTSSFVGPNQQVSWGYNWGQTIDATFPSAYEFVPMLWSNASDLTATWSATVEKAIARGTSHLLSFNEPDQSGQADMSPKAAAEAYIKWMQPYAGRVKLGAPAITNGGAPMGLTWMGQFMGNCTACTIDFVPIHWYAGASDEAYFQTYIKQTYAQVKKPIWITEFSGAGSQDDETAFLKMVMPWLDSLSYVQRYAWFWTSPGYLISSGTTLSETGMAFNNYTSSTVDPSFTS